MSALAHRLQQTCIIAVIWWDKPWDRIIPKSGVTKSGVRPYISQSKSGVTIKIWGQALHFTITRNCGVACKA